jgi:predicted enzyme related to lactoylglutathione lyase
MALSFAALEVRDLQASKSFYENVLGFEASPAMRPDAVIMKTDENGASFAIKRITPASEGATRLGAGVAIWFRCLNVDDLEARVNEAGGTVILAAQEGPFGRMVVVLDPDGHALTFHNA